MLIIIHNNNQLDLPFLCIPTKNNTTFMKKKTITDLNVFTSFLIFIVRLF